MDRTGADVFQRTASLRPNYRSPQKFKPARLPTLPFEAYSASTRSFLQSSQLPDITPAALPAQGDQTRPRTSSSFMSGEWGCMPCVPCPCCVPVYHQTLSMCCWSWSVAQFQARQLGWLLCPHAESPHRCGERCTGWGVWCSRSVLREMHCFAHTANKH